MKFYIKLNFQTSLQKAMAQNSILLFNILQKRTQKFAPLFSKASIDSWENPVALLIGNFNDRVQSFDNQSICLNKKI